MCLALQQLHAGHLQVLEKERQISKKKRKKDAPRTWYHPMVLNCRADSADVVQQVPVLPGVPFKTHPTHPVHREGTFRFIVFSTDLQPRESGGNGQG
jgi:hypothetical protein